MFRLFRLGCWQVDATGGKVEKTLMVNPRYVMGIESEDGYTVLHMSFGTFYTNTLGDVIQQGLNDVTRLNEMVIMRN